MRGFWSNRDGNIAITFALILIPLLGFVGVALDYSMATAYRTDLQKALDATALALTKIMPADQATLDTVGNQYFQANLGPHTLTNLQLTVTPNVGTLRVSVKGTYNVQLASVIGATSVELGARAEAKWSIGKVEIALVLDNSWSMNSLSRMTHLKDAAHDLLDVLEAAAKEEGDAKVAIVPFDSIVGVGTAYKNESWLRWDILDCNGNQSGSGCGSIPQDTWNGCVWDRNKDNDTKDDAPGSTNATKYPAVQCGNSLNSNLLVPLTPLTTNWTALHSKVNSMSPAGMTNITIGLVWGWHVLSPTALFTEGAAYNTANLTKYVILMTDGDNTANRFGDSTNTMNNRTSTTCTNIKNANIKIYTIRLVSGNATLLQGCASNPSMYYDVQDASELSAVFSSIGSQIANLHLSK